VKILFIAIVTFLPQIAVAKLEGKKLAKAEKILTDAEKFRAPEQGISYVTLISENKRKTITYQLEVFLGPEKRALVEFKEPVIERGRRMLMQGSQYFAKFRHSKSAVPISRREAVGNSTFALADIFRLELEDYDVMSMKSVTEGDAKLIKLELKAKNRDVPYDKVLYYVKTEDKLPLKAEFFGISGRHLKSLFIEEKKTYNGVIRASKVRMDDIVQTDRKSWWITKEIEEKKIPQKIFTKDYLVRD
jgi:hypothetical protein